MPQLPNALVVGPLKGGTTWIHDYLMARNDVCLPNGVKETFFFGEHFDKGEAWYSKHFSQFTPNQHKLIVEVAPSYFHQNNAPIRIKELLGNIPLVFTLRDPVRRAWSHYLHLQRYGFTTATLREATRQFPEILEASRYRTCLKRWHEYFSGEFMHILWQDLLVKSPEEYAQALCKALALPYEPVPASLVGNSNQAAVPPSYFLAGLGSKTSQFMRSKRLYSIVNFAKRIGLKSLFYGKPGARSLPELQAGDADWLTEQLQRELPDDFLLGNKKTELLWTD